MKLQNLFIHVLFTNFLITSHSIIFVKLLHMNLFFKILVKFNSYCNFTEKKVFKSYLRKELLNFPSLQRNYCNMVSDSMNNIAGVDMHAGTQGLQLSLYLINQN